VEVFDQLVEKLAQMFLIGPRYAMDITDIAKRLIGDSFREWESIGSNNHRSFPICPTISTGVSGPD
jgi:hypothetical protein